MVAAESPHHSWAKRVVQSAMEAGSARINPLIYAEVCGTFEEAQEAEEVLPSDLILRDALPYAAARPAVQAFRLYRGRGGKRTTCLPDFFIGAHAEVSGYPLLTRDVQRFRTYFPTVELRTPVAD